MYLNLKLRLWTTGLRQHQLAHLVGVDETLLSKIINGHRKPDCNLRAAIARVLNSSEGWLFEVVQPGPRRNEETAEMLKSFAAAD